MAITTVLFYILARNRWNWSLAKAGSLAGFFSKLGAQLQF